MNQTTNPVTLAILANFASAAMILCAAVALFTNGPLIAILLATLAGALNPLGPVRPVGYWYYRHSASARTPMQRRMAALLDARFGPLPDEEDDE